METYELSVTKIRCTNCAKKITNSLSALTGKDNQNINS